MQDRIQRMFSGLNTSIQTLSEYIKEIDSEEYVVERHIYQAEFACGILSETVKDWLIYEEFDRLWKSRVDCKAMENYVAVFMGDYKEKLKELFAYMSKLCYITESEERGLNRFLEGSITYDTLKDEVFGGLEIDKCIEQKFV